MVEFRMQIAKLPSGAWKEVEDYHIPYTIAATKRLNRDFVNIRMTEDGIPLMFLGEGDMAAQELSILVSRTCVEKVNRHTVSTTSRL